MTLAELRASRDLAALRDALSLLAAPAEAQLPALEAFHSIVHELRAGIPDADPIDARVARAGRVTAATRDALATLDARIAYIVDEDELWTPDAVRSSDDWAEIRTLAAEALREL